MINIGITIYGVGIQDENNQDCNLQNIKDKTLLGILQEFIMSNNSEYSDDEDYKKVFLFDYIGVNQFSNFYISKNYEEQNLIRFRYIIGRVKTGAYGVTAEIIGKNTGKLNYKRNRNDAEVMPFYFAIAIPEGDCSKGILILQSQGIYGMKTIFESNFDKVVKTKAPNHKLYLNNIAPQGYIERYLNNGILKKLTFLRYGVPDDICDRLNINDRENVLEEYSIRNPIGFIRGARDRILEATRNASNISNIVEIMNFEYDNVKMVFELNGSEKTINLENISKLKLTENITELLDVEDGNVKYNEIEPIIEERLKGYLSDMGLINLEEENII